MSFNGRARKNRPQMRFVMVAVVGCGRGLRWWVAHFTHLRHLCRSTARKICPATPTRCTEIYDTMQTQLAGILDQFNAAWVRVRELAENLSEEQWVERTDPERWCVAECVAHLNRTAEAYLPLIGAGLDEARELSDPVRARYRRDPLGWALSLSMGPVRSIGRFRLVAVQTTPDFMPERRLPRAELIADFDRLQDAQMQAVRAAEGLPIDRVRITSPFDSRLRYNLYSTFVILPTHQRRHVVQAERVWEL